MLLLAVVPAVLVLASSYGGEIIFRAYLFALPFGAFLAASLWFPVNRAKPGVLATAALTGSLLVFTSGVLVADFGIDNRLVFDDHEVAAADYVAEHARPGALIVEGTRDYPRQFRRYEQFVYLTIDRALPHTLEKLRKDPAGTLASWLRDSETYNGGYVILTESQRRSVTSLGTDLAGTLDQIQAALEASDEFKVAFRSGDAVVFELRGPLSRWWSWLRRQVIRRPGLAWLVATTSAVLIRHAARCERRDRLPFVILFILTVPGCLVIDVELPRDAVAKVVIGIGGSLSFHLLVVSIALLGSLRWVVPVLGTFAIALAAWLRSRSRARRTERSTEPDEAARPA